MNSLTTTQGTIFDRVRREANTFATTVGAVDTTINILGEQLPIDIIEFKQFEIENVNYNKLVKTYENAINKMINEQRVLTPEEVIEYNNEVIKEIYGGQ